MEDRRKRRSRNIAVAAVVCVLALVAIGVMMWHPWDAGVPSGSESGGEEVAASDDAGGAQGVEGDTPEPADEPSQDTGQQEEAWPGQSEGYVGPNGEGVIKREDYDSDEEYMRAMIGSTKERDWDWSDYAWVTNDERVRYFQGEVQVTFYRNCGEERAHEIVEGLGGAWLDDEFAWDTGMDFVSATLCFPKDADVFSIAEELSTNSEVKSASPTIYCLGQLAETGGTAQALLADDPATPAARNMSARPST